MYDAGLTWNWRPARKIDELPRLVPAKACALETSDTSMFSTLDERRLISRK